MNYITVLLVDVLHIVDLEVMFECAVVLDN